MCGVFCAMHLQVSFQIQNFWITFRFCMIWPSWTTCFKQHVDMFLYRAIIGKRSVYPLSSLLSSANSYQVLCSKILLFDSDRSNEQCILIIRSKRKSVYICSVNLKTDEERIRYFPWALLLVSTSVSGYGFVYYMICLLYFCIAVTGGQVSLVRNPVVPFK